MTVKEFVHFRKDFLKAEFANLGRTATLAIIQVNDDQASNTYIKGKKKDCAEIGVNALHIALPTSISEEDLISKIEELNNDPSIDGLIVQMPLPKHINENKIKNTVNPLKDVDGFHPLSKYTACTPKGIVLYLENEGIDIDGKNAVVIGRSNIVGKPMAKLLLSKNANVTVLHSHTSHDDMARYLKYADIIVVAVGKKHFLTDAFELKETAVVVDVGINRDEEGLHGDAMPNLKVKLQTPVPGGVGLLTRLALLENLLEVTKHGI